MAKDKVKPAKKKGGKKAKKVASTVVADAQDIGVKALDALEKVVEHPIVSELIAAGAMAAIAAVASSGKLDPKELASKDALKAAGKAAAAAVGARLVKQLESSGGKAAARITKKS